MVKDTAQMLVEWLVKEAELGVTRPCRIRGWRVVYFGAPCPHCGDSAGAGFGATLRPTDRYMVCRHCLEVIKVTADVLREHGSHQWHTARCSTGEVPPTNAQLRRMRERCG